MSSLETERQEIVVLGAGVVGLTTALKIQEQGDFRVTIVAETFPNDPKTIKYTSFWAGAQVIITRKDDKKLERAERETFDVMWEMSSPNSPAQGCFLRCTDRTYHVEKIQRPHPCEHLPDFKYLKEDELILGAVEGVSFTTVTIDLPIYLNYLLSRFLGSGGRIVRGSVTHIQQVLEGDVGSFTNVAKTSSPYAVVVCAGLGARFIGGIEDKKVHAIRGQTVLIRAPWAKDMPIHSTTHGNPSYVIPRRGGDVVLGGTFHPNDWYPKPRPEITQRILKEALEMYPELASPEVRATREPTVEDLRSLVIEECVGLRPGREGGLRLEMEMMDVGPGAKDKKIPVVFNYGHGGNGYQSSWGCASMVLELLQGL